ncbi:MAG: hypothetical protein ABSB35_34020 [Bryobacteraceae bacterium]
MPAIPAAHWPSDDAPLERPSKIRLACTIWLAGQRAALMQPVAQSLFSYQALGPGQVLGHVIARRGLEVPRQYARERANL